MTGRPRATTALLNPEATKSALIPGTAARHERDVIEVTRLRIDTTALGRLVSSPQAQQGDPNRLRRLLGLLLAGPMLAGAAALGLGSCGADTDLPVGVKTVEILNVSFDPTRKLYREINADFEASWNAAHPKGPRVTVAMSHGGSGRQARAVIDGLKADVVTLGLPLDIDKLAEKGLTARDWQDRLPARSTPYYSTIVFLVRAGNPKGITDWGDLAKPGVSVITPNPRTSGGARFGYLAAWAWAVKQPGGSDAAAREYLSRIYANVEVFDTAARAATTTFAQRGLGDVLVTWENEAWLAKAELGPDRFEIINPSLSIRAEPSVAAVDSVTARRGTGDIAQAYLDFLYTPEAQEVMVANHFRPSNPEVAARHDGVFPDIPMVTVEEVFGSWAEAQKAHFADGGVFDQITVKGRNRPS
jgi:sulfate/thiosulfate transport system substrate-binding protein